MSRAHQEIQFERDIVASLTEQGWRNAESSEYDARRALVPGDVVDFVRETQPTRWEYWRNIHGDRLEAKLVEEVAERANKKGSLDVLRHGFRFSGRGLDLAYFRPANTLNPDLLDKYEQNRLTVIRQVPPDPRTGETVDLGLFLNGMPVATAELKTPTTGQTWRHATEQYRERNSKAPLFRHKERALVHFAVDPDQVHMTTELAGESTHFLPFNKGRHNGAGNPPAEGDRARTHYLWEQFWAPETFLKLLDRYLHVRTERERDPSTGRVNEEETVIFPRYHQYECVEQLIEATRENGPGENYLIQHSTGSGKSISIAWLAHRLQNLHDADDEPIYDAIVVVTDRRVLDDQIKELLRRALPTRDNEEQMEVDVEDVAGLTYYTNQKTGEGSLETEDSKTVDPPTDVATGEARQQEMVELSQIIEAINERFGTDFDEEHSVVNQARDQVAADPDVQQAARVNDEEHFKDKVRTKAEDAFYERHAENEKLVTRIAEDDAFKEQLLDLVLGQVYREAREEA